MKTTIRIATGTYEYLEVEGDETDIPRLLELQNQYSEKPVQFKKGQTRRVKAFVGGEIDYNEETHTYSWNGEKYLSGSEYAKSKKKPFDPIMMSTMAAKKTGSNPAEIAKLWELGGKVSREFGTNVHEALEVYGKYKELCTKLEKEYHLPNHPVLKKIVESFYEGRDGETAEYEVLIVDHKTKRAGCVDRLVHTAEVKNVIIQDFKITHKEDLEYWKDQLEFYAGIMRANGWTVQGKEIHKYDGNWTKVDV